MALKYTTIDMHILASKCGLEFLSKEYSGIMKKHEWKCDRGHMWYARPNDIKSGCRCPYCAGKRKTIDYLILKIKNRPICLLDHKYVGMHEKYRWQCLVCNNAWHAEATSVAVQQTGCPYCAGRRRNLSDIQNIAYGRNFNLISDKFVGMAGKYKWECSDGHTWLATAQHVKNGTGCPYCNSYITEEACRFVFQELTGYNFKKNRSTLGTRLELDGYCHELKMAFEYQGKQHYSFIKHLHRRPENHESQKRRDDLKRSLCKEQGINLLEIPYYENDLESFIKEQLTSLNIKCSASVDWKKFKGRISMLEELRLAADRLNVESLSEVYINARSKMDFKCNKCGREWESTSNEIKNGHGCLKCGGNMKLTIDEVQMRGRKVNIELLSNEYINARTKLRWKCNKCNHVFMKTPPSIQRIQQGKGCPSCGRQNAWKARRELTCCES